MQNRNLFVEITSFAFCLSVLALLNGNEIITSWHSETHFWVSRNVFKPITVDIPECSQYVCYHAYGHDGYLCLYPDKQRCPPHVGDACLPKQYSGVRWRGGKGMGWMALNLRSVSDNYCGVFFQFSTQCTLRVWFPRAHPRGGGGGCRAAALPQTTPKWKLKNTDF
jgi:hypothetical protein